MYGKKAGQGERKGGRKGGREEIYLSRDGVDSEKSGHVVDGEDDHSQGVNDL